MELSDTIVLASFDAIDDLAERAASGALTEADRQFGSSHSLVLLSEATLESMSPPHLGKLLVGLNRATLEDLREVRAQLENADTKEPLQVLLYAFEEICDLLTSAGYGDVAQETADEFFGSALPQWLDRVHAWAHSESLGEIAARVSAASTSYASLGDGWWST